MKKILIIPFLLILLLLSCDKYRSKAIVADYVTGSKYEIIKVDGRAVERIQHGSVITRVPFVILEQGSHTLTLLKIKGNFEDKSGQTIELRVNVEKGMKYQLVEKDGKVVLIKENNMK